MNIKDNIKKYIAFVLLVILVVAGLTFIIKNNEKMEKRLKAKPENYYSRSENYVIYNDKIYYYNMDSKDRGRIFQMDLNGKNNRMLCISEHLKTPKILYAFENSIYCECPYVSTSEQVENQTDEMPYSTTKYALLKIDTKSGEINEVSERELPILGITSNDEATLEKQKLEIDGVQYEQIPMEYSFDDSEVQEDNQDQNAEYYDETLEKTYYYSNNAIYEYDEIQNKIEKIADNIKEAPIKSILIKNCVVFDYKCNVISVKPENGIGVYNKESKEYRTHSNIRHYDVDRDNEKIYLQDENYKVTQLKI